LVGLRGASLKFYLLTYSGGEKGGLQFQDSLGKMAMRVSLNK
jgi:hypothetical protein